MPTEFSVNKRDTQFVLYEQLNADELCQAPAYAECNREVFEMVLGEAVKVATEVLAPLNKIGDQVGLKLEKGVVTTPAGFKEGWKTFGEGGWAGMVHPPEVGGQGLPVMLKFATNEMFAGANIALFLSSMLTEGAAHLVEKFGTPEMRKLYCEKMYSLQWGGTMCLTEPQAGSDVGALKTTARKNGDHYLISGSKTFISAGEHDMVENIIHPVLARIEGAPAGTKGISLFVVPKILVNPDGSLGARNDMICSSIEHKMGIKASPTCTLNFGDEGHCKGFLLGEENSGMRLMFQMMNDARLVVGLQGLGLASVAYQSALGYAQERVQGTALGDEKGGRRITIIHHPDVRRMLMHMKSYVEGLRSMMCYVGKCIDLAHVGKTEDERDRAQHMVELLTPICKAYGTDMGFKINELAIQVYGGYGYIQEYPVEQYCRDQKIASLYEGTNGIQAMDLLGRKLTMKGGLYFREYVEMVSKLIEAQSGDGELSPLAARLDKAKNELVEITMHFASILGKGLNQPFLNAYPYLEAFGHVTTAYFLLDGAAVAQKKLQAIAAKAGGVTEKLLAENSEAAFYHGRIASARYFTANVLPHVQAIKDGILSGDYSALEVVYKA